MAEAAQDSKPGENRQTQSSGSVHVCTSHTCCLGDLLELVYLL